MDWPEWLDQRPYEIGNFIKDYGRQLRKLQGSVQLVAGGPPCQGFSVAGLRKESDQRNWLFRSHLEIVKLLKPKIVLLENVRGIDYAFSARKGRGRAGRPPKTYAGRIEDMLVKLGYHVQRDLIKAVDFGVPQLRPRYFCIGIRKDLYAEEQYPNFFKILDDKRKAFLKKHGLPTTRPVTVGEAISDLRQKGTRLTDCLDPESPPGFKEIIYKGPVSKYQKLMHGRMNGEAINSLRLVNHRPGTVLRFKEILRTCRKGINISAAERASFGVRKTALAPLDSGKPSLTLTTLPDDLIHYEEPRVHTVREYARLQSFPDWFEFLGAYTTGGRKRKLDCPRYTQVGNAIPPLLAEAIGETLSDCLGKR